MMQEKKKEIEEDEDYKYNDEDHRNRKAEEDHEDDEIKKKKILVKSLAFQKLFSYADSLDWILMALGILGSVVHGMAQPIGYLLLGKALDAFGQNINDFDAMVVSLKKVYFYLFIAICVAATVTHLYL